MSALVLRYVELDPLTLTPIVPPSVEPGAAVAIIGPPGAGSGSSAAVSAVCDAALPAGTPLAISRANGHLVKADAATKAVAFVVGLARAATSIGFVADAEPVSLTLPDWTAVAGTTLLSVGQIYFLGVGGGLTLAQPGNPNCSALVGEAVTTTTLKLTPSTPIQL